MPSPRLAGYSVTAQPFDGLIDPARCERLAQEYLHALIAGLHLALQVWVFVGHDDLQRGYICPRPAQENDPILAGEVQVHQHEVRFDLPDECLRLPNLPRLPDLVTPLLEVAGERLRRAHICLDEQHANSHMGRF